jgi:hypothetical protein
VVVAAVALVLALAALLALRLYAVRRLARAEQRFEAEVGSLDASTYAPPPIEERRQNAAFWLETGAGALAYDDRQTTLLEQRLAALGQPWTADDQTAFLALLADNAEARGLINRAANLERSSFGIDYGGGPGTELPDFLDLLRAARLLAVECDFRLGRGERDQALAVLHLLERLAAAQRAETVLIALLTGAAAERLYLDRLEAVLGDATLTVDELRDLRRDLDHLDSVTVAPQRSLAVDIALSSRSSLHAPLEWPAELPEPPERRRWRHLLPLHRLFGTDRLEAAMMLESGVRLVESLDTPLASVDLGDYARRVVAPRGGLPGVGTVARLMAPNYLNAIQREQWTRSSRQLARLAVDLRLGRVGHGSYPERPTELLASAATGEAASFAMLADGSVEIAFPEAEASWETEKKRLSAQPGRDYNLRWRLPR